jgi:pimeloyl-ACP methyl ester carboxylesterase
MEPFTLTLGNGATLTGLSNIPKPSPTTPKYRPLIVGLHGGSYSSSYFNVDAKHTAALASNALSVPFIAINRPGIAGSTSLYPLPPDSSDAETHAAFLHNHILPALWTQFGLSNGCNSLTLLCHSLGTPIAIMAASLFATSHPPDSQPQPPYPLAGIIFSGFGIQLIPDSGPKPDPNTPPPEFLEFTADVKNAIMMPPGTCDPSVYAYHDRLNVKFPFREVSDIHTVWLPRIREEWAKDVTVPVMFGIAERDCYWRATREHVDEMRRLFGKSPRVEGEVVKRAPHNLEISYWAQGWYARGFGFAVECAASWGVGFTG